MMQSFKIFGFLVMICLSAACSPNASPTATATTALTEASTPTRPSMMGQLIPPTTDPDATPEPGELIEETVRSFFTALFQGEDVTAYICKDVGENSKWIEAYGPTTEAEYAEAVNSEQVDVGMSINPEGIYNVNAKGTFVLTVNGTDKEIDVDMFDTPMAFEDNSWKICG